MKKYLQTSFKENLKNRKYYFIHNTPVFIINSFPKNIDTNYIMKSVEEVVPSSFMQGIEGVYIGEFPELKARDIQAFSRDDAIYLSSFHDEPNISPELIVRDIVHEVSHSLEENYYYEIYDDNLIKREYEAKKRRLADLLRAEGFEFPDKLFFSDDYVDELDDFLYKKIGYDKISLLSVGLFLSPYSVTSIREYFANGFEEYLMGDYEYLKDISPILFKKIEELVEME
jgi:hypothetical protein|tara:strand:- start:3285 stop:3968 length:684 start_codon:yes stop_codon:yes gene_type:complete